MDFKQFTHFVISVDELWLKGKNRKFYLKTLLTHIQVVLKNYHQSDFKSVILSNRIFYSSQIQFEKETLLALLKIPGISTLSPCYIVPRSQSNDSHFDEIQSAVLTSLDFLNSTPFTFKVDVRRIDKNYPKSSMEMNSDLGHLIHTKFNLSKVDVKKPQYLVDVRILENHITLSAKVYKGLGGLPFGTSGHALTLLSGGFDSPVASYLMFKRGIKQSYIFFHAYPFVGDEVLDKIYKLTSILSMYQQHSHLYIVPFGKIQTLISKTCPEDYRTMFFRKFMVEISNKICDIIGASALITGDCIGQVSSQTLGNLQIIDGLSEKIIFRPLIGFNKLEILNLAKQINTHDTSVLPHDDACALFAPKNPVIKPNLKIWNEWKSTSELDHAIESAILETQSFSVNLKGEIFKKDFFSFDS